MIIRPILPRIPRHVLPKLLHQVLYARVSLKENRDANPVANLGHSTQFRHYGRHLGGCPEGQRETGSLPTPATPLAVHLPLT